MVWLQSFRAFRSLLIQVDSNRLLKGPYRPQFRAAKSWVHMGPWRAVAIAFGTVFVDMGAHFPCACPAATSKYKSVGSAPQQTHLASQEVQDDGNLFFQTFPSNPSYFLGITLYGPPPHLQFQAGLALNLISSQGFQNKQVDRSPNNRPTFFVIGFGNCWALHSGIT